MMRNLKNRKNLRNTNRSNLRTYHRRRNPNTIKTKLMYNFSSRVQTLGPGTMTVNITSNIDQLVDTLSYVTVNDLVKSNDEFAKQSANFKLYKVVEIAVTVYPSDNKNSDPTYINLDWFNNITTINGIKNADSTKIVYNDLKKPKTFFFKLPNLVYLGRNIRKFQHVSDDLYGLLMFYHDGAQLRARVDARVVFKVPTEYISNRGIQLKTVEELSKLDLSNASISTNQQEGITQTSFSIIPNNEPYWLQLDEDPKIENIESKEKKINYKKQKKNQKKRERRKKRKEKLAALEKNKKISKLKEKYEEKLKKLENKEKQLEENKQINKAWKEHNFYVAEGLANQKNELKREAAQLKKYKENVHRQEDILNKKKKEYLNRKHNLEKKYPSFEEDQKRNETHKLYNKKWYDVWKNQSQSNESFSYQSSNKRKGRVCHADKSMSVSQAFDESSWYA